MEKSRNIIVQLKSELKTRQEAREFLPSLESVGLDDVLVFDFTHVRFVGRSFADEFFNLYLKNSQVRTENMSCDIKVIFDTVSSTQDKKKKVNSNVQIREFTNMEELNQYLSLL